MKELSPTRALVNAGLALFVIVLAVWGSIQVAQRHWNWQKTYLLETTFSRIGGLAAGDRVRLQGMDAGVVQAIEPPRKPGGPITVVLRIDEHLRELIRSDAVATIVANAVGPKVVEISPGKPNAPRLPEGATLHSTDPVELGDLMVTGREALQQLQGITREAEEGMKNINAITGSISRGEGTLGKLVRDDAAYNQLMSLARSSEKAIGTFDENLSAMKGIWPFSGYFKDRGYEEPERVLYRPNATRDNRVLSSDELFRPGTAILTDAGNAALDAFARWFKVRRWPDTTEVVIAAFTDGPKDDDAARILTQDQAKAVRNYLEQKHKLFELPLFRQRKVAAVGCGTRKPKPDPNAESNGGSADPAELPARRVEIVLFTPK